MEVVQEKRNKIAAKTKTNVFLWLRTYLLTREEEIIKFRYKNRRICLSAFLYLYGIDRKTYYWAKNMTSDGKQIYFV